MVGAEVFTPEQQEQTHNILVEGFVSRYLERSGALGKVAFGTPFDPNRDICDYNKTWWEAAPNRFSIPVGNFVLGMMHKMSGREISLEFASLFYEKADDINRQLTQSPLVIVNGHNPDLQAALSIFAANQGLAEKDKADWGTNFLKNFYDRTRASHGVATRGVVPIGIGKSPSSPLIDFIRLERLVVNPHHSFPKTKQMLESGIDLDFIGRYNELLRDDAAAVAIDKTVTLPNHDEMKTFWSMAPGGKPDEEIDDSVMKTAIVDEATVRLITEQMGAAIMPVYTSFGKGKRPTKLELGSIIKPEDVTSSALHGTMADLAEFRRRNGEPNVYYAGELDLAA